MSLITKSSDAGLEGNSGEKLTPITAQAGVEIAAGDALYLDSNGRFLKAVRTVQFITGSFGTAMKFAGLAAVAIPSGTYGECYGRGSEWHYADSGLTGGNAVYPSATAGGLDNSPAAANDHPVAMVIDATNIRLIAGV